MNQDNQDPEVNNPLGIAKWLEEKVELGHLANRDSVTAPDTPNDFGLAMKGLDLVRRAVLVDQLKDTESSQKHGHRNGDRPQADTDRLGGTEVDTCFDLNLEDSRQAIRSEPNATYHQLPRRIDRFEIIRELGRGGFGVVLLGRDPELDRMVAIKIPRLQMFVDADARSRFDREACLVSMLSHPAIVPVFEYSSGPGVPFIAFAWCRGCSLADWLSKSKATVSPRLASRMVCQLAGAVQYAHQRGVIHRDLKPANILLDIVGLDDKLVIQDDDLVAALRITDFGLAKSLQSNAPKLTREGAMVGTPTYMAPEQFSGRTDLSVAVDIYSLGAILYELLTGRPPLQCETDLATMRAVETQEPVRPSRIRQEISRDLEAVVLKCLEKLPKDRYQTAFDLQQDLERAISGRPVTARRSTAAERMVRWCRRNPSIAVLGGTTSAAILAAMAASLVGWHSTTQALNREKSARHEADQAYSDAKSAIDQYFVTVSENQLLAAPGLKTLRQELLQNAVVYYSSFIERHREDDALAWDLIKAFIYRATVDEELGNLAASREGFETALQRLEELRAANMADPKLKQQHGVLLRRLAKFAGRDNNLKSAIEKIEAAAVLHRELLETGHDLAATHGELGLLLRENANLLNSTGNPNEAFDLHVESEAHFQTAMTLDPANPHWTHQFAMSQVSQAIVHQQLGRPDRAGEPLTNVSKLLAELIDQYPDQLHYQLDRGKALANLSLIQSNLGQTDESLASLREATGVFDRLALIHPQVVIYQALRCSTRRNAALTLNNLGRMEECKQLAHESMTILEEMRDEASEHPAIRQEKSQTHSILGRVYQVQGQKENARQHLDLAIQSLHQEFVANPNNLHMGQSLAEALQQRALVADSHTQELELLDRGKSIIQTLLEARPNNPNLSGMLKINEQTRQMLVDKNLGN